LGEALEGHADVSGLIQGARNAPEVRQTGFEPRPRPAARRIRIGLACDRAFHFYYQDNLDALERHGCDLVRFSPLDDDAIPRDLDGMYIGGGYPEEYAEGLAGNMRMIRSIRRFAESGKPVYGECGGLMYLGTGIKTLDGRSHKLVGLLPAWTRMLDRLKSLGYAEVTFAVDSLFGRKGFRLRGHEFHYSELLDDPTKEGAWTAVYLARHRRSDGPVPEGFQCGRVLVSYIHMHFASQPEAVAHFVTVCEGQL
jgi:cobyrinic acid a,c-diamide synthase